MIGIKSKNGFYLFGQNVWIVPKWEEVFLGSFTIGGMVNQSGSKSKERPKIKKVFSLKETKSKKKDF